MIDKYFSKKIRITSDVGTGAGRVGPYARLWASAQGDEMYRGEGDGLAWMDGPIEKRQPGARSRRIQPGG